MSRPVRVVICEDQEIVRDGLAAVLDREPDINVVGKAASAEEALTLIPAVAPDVAVVDYRLPGMTGVELCERLQEVHAEVAVVILTSYFDDEVIFGAMRAGARAFAYKDVAAVELKRTVREVVQGKTLLDPVAAKRVFGWAERGRLTPDEPLSRREVEVLRHVAAGRKNQEIALMGLTDNTVRTYLKRALEKLGCHSRSEAAAIATRKGLL
jgi:DNA-binding NarL/FixJ family response regulator